MQIQVNTDNHIKGSQELSDLVEGVVEDTLSRFGDQVTRVIAHFTDESSRAKSVGDDKRCVLEARLAGLQPITVTGDGASVKLALNIAADKLERAIESVVGKLGHTKGRTSFGGEQMV